MARWPTNPVRPDLRELNGGQKFTEGSAVVADTFNQVVTTLLSLKQQTGTHSVRIKCNYPQYIEESILLTEAAYSTDGGTTWTVLDSGATVSVVSPQIRFRIGCFLNHTVSIRIKSPTLQLDMSRSTFGYSLSPVYSVNQNIIDVTVT